MPKTSEGLSCLEDEEKLYKISLDSNTPIRKKWTNSSYKHKTKSF